MIILSKNQLKVILPKLKASVQNKCLGKCLKNFKCNQLLTPAKHIDSFEKMLKPQASFPAPRIFFLKKKILQFFTSSAKALKTWKGTIHSGQSTASCNRIVVINIIRSLE